MAALFGSRVRRLRLAAGLTQAELGERVHVVASRITQVERASGARPTLELARALDRALGADGLLVDLWPYVHREAFPDWSRAFIAHSERAASIRQYAAQLVPGLLQTPAYARAVLSVGFSLRDDAHLEERVSTRLARQERLRLPDPPDLWVVLDEAVLRRPVGGWATTRAQLAHLLRAAAEARVTLQVLPFDQGEHDMIGGSLTVLDLPGSEQIAYSEGAHYGQLIEEPAEVKRFALAYDRLRAAALPPRMSLDMIRSAMEGINCGAHVPSQSERRHLAQEQLQQSGGWRLRRGRPRGARRGPRA
ncbi:Scr1 family TA system antitoxin-like transcriptional regulator [Streptomyces sp. NPDC090306]|uniref:helix-turn-helix domain-containing protein n=1 Tax=unclassified Streptomyces TaxID=2593676 RepID=UPI0036EDAB78